MIKKLSGIVGVVVISSALLIGCSPEKAEEVQTIVDNSVEIVEYEKKIKANEEELKTVKAILELTKQAVEEREESIGRLKSRIIELEDMIEFPEADLNKKNYTGIGDSEFLPMPIQNKDSKGDSDFD